MNGTLPLIFQLAENTAAFKLVFPGVGAIYYSHQHPIAFIVSNSPLVVRRDFWQRKRDARWIHKREIEDDVRTYYSTTDIEYVDDFFERVIKAFGNYMLYAPGINREQHKRKVTI